MPEHFVCVEEFLLTARHHADLVIEVEPEELVDNDWTVGFE